METMLFDIPFPPRFAVAFAKLTGLVCRSRAR